MMQRTGIRRELEAVPQGLLARACVRRIKPSRASFAKTNVQVQQQS
jgi:hypothetical protein